MAKKRKPKSRNEIPEEFLKRLDLIAPNPAQKAQILQTFKERPTTFRVNTLKATKEEVVSTLIKNQFQIKQVEFYDPAFILLNKSKRELTDLDIYKEGKIYIQSLASMVPVIALDPEPNEKVLDLTAAPGSKTSQIAAQMQNQGELIANDVNKVRFFKLKHNLELLGADKITTLRLEHGSHLCQEFTEPTFDKILLDAPCSAEARFKSDDPKSFMYWNKHKIKDMAYKQRKLLLSAWPTLKPGGTLVYSTCTFAPEENEIQIHKFLQRTEDAIIQPIEIFELKRLDPVQSYNDKPLDPQIKNALRIMPTNQIEGFFIAKITKMM